ncbi:MAG: hypothetical protein AAF183_13065 [Pseudomonadota bacterium]
MTEAELYRNARQALDAQTDHDVLREMAAHALVREHRLGQLESTVSALRVDIDDRLTRLEDIAADLDRVYQRAWGGAWVLGLLCAVFGLAIWHRDKFSAGVRWFGALLSTPPAG